MCSFLLCDSTARQPVWCCMYVFLRWTQDENFIIIIVIIIPIFLVFLNVFLGLLITFL